MAKILIVDDEEAILKMYGDALSGHDVLFAENGEKGIEMAAKEEPDLILLDIIMPQMNGLDVLEKLKDNKDTANIPVLMLTNLPAEASEDKAKALGAKEYFVKAEFEPDKLSRRVNELLE